MGNLDAEGEYVTPVYDTSTYMQTSLYSAIQHHNDYIKNGTDVQMINVVWVRELSVDCVTADECHIAWRRNSETERFGAVVLVAVATLTPHSFKLPSKDL